MNQINLSELDFEIEPRALKILSRSHVAIYRHSRNSPRINSSTVKTSGLVADLFFSNSAGWISKFCLIIWKLYVRPSGLKSLAGFRASYCFQRSIWSEGAVVFPALGQNWYPHVMLSKLTDLDSVCQIGKLAIVILSQLVQVFGINCQSLLEVDWLQFTLLGTNVKDHFRVTAW